jgi:hypothetical protein
MQHSIAAGLHCGSLSEMCQCKWQITEHIHHAVQEEAADTAEALTVEGQSSGCGHAITGSMSQLMFVLHQS